MTFLRRLSGLSIVALMGCGGATFTTDGDAGADGAGGNDAAVGNDAGGKDAVGEKDASPSADGADAGLPPDADLDGGSCVTAMITFAIQTAPGSAKSYCIGGAAGSCAGGWLSIRPANGNALTIDSPCVTACGVCQPMACGGACAAPTQLPAAGAKRTWDGTDYAAGTCGAGISCVSASCAPPGRYTARMCGHATVAPDAAVGPCVGAATPTCVDVPFDWPPPSGGVVVQGTLGP